MVYYINSLFNDTCLNLFSRKTYYVLLIKLILNIIDTGYTDMVASSTRYNTKCIII